MNGRSHLRVQREQGRGGGIRNLERETKLADGRGFGAASSRALSSTQFYSVSRQDSISRQDSVRRLPQQCALEVVDRRAAEGVALQTDLEDTSQRVSPE